MTYELMSSAVEFAGKIFEVRVDRLKLPSGQQMRFDYVVHSGAVAIVPFDERGRIWFVKQYRHAVRRQLLEIPAGTLEADEPPEVCAARECREEIGMAPGNLEPIGGFYPVPGYSSEYIHVFLATDLRPDPLPGDEDELLEVSQIDLEQVLEMLHSGEINDAKTLAAIAMALPRTQR
jgi:ADP-ribose pyrophosphatase